MSPLFLLVLCLSLFTLSACQTGKGYKTLPKKQTQKTASSTPNAIGTSTQDTPLSPSQETEETELNYPRVNIAILLPLSGKHKDLGTAMLNAAQIALFDTGYPNLNLIPRDTQGTEDGARNAAKSAIDDGAQIILGPVFASSVRAVSPITTQARINMLAFSTDWTLAGNGTYIMGFLPFDQVRRVTQYAASQNIQHIGTITPNTNYGRAVKNTFERIAPRHNITITSDATFRPHSSNLAPTVRQFSHYEERIANNALGQAPFNAVLMPTGGQDARSIANLLSHNNLPPRRVRRLGTGLLDDPALATESNLDGAWFAAPSPGARKKFEQRYYETFNQKAPRLSTLAYDATALAATLARQNLHTRNSNIFNKASLTNPNGFYGVDGIFRFRPDGTAERGLAILSFKRGKIIVIDEPPKTFQRN